MVQTGSDVPATTVGITAGECHLWHVPVTWRDEWLALLDTVERNQVERIQVEFARTTFVTSRAAQRLIGAHYLGIPAESVEIVRDCEHCVAAKHGRPRLPGANIDYSVSHTNEIVVIAVVGEGRVGVDIESIHSARNVDGLAGTTLARAELEEFARIRRADRAEWFLTAWTRKEAAMKLTGFGLRAPPNQLDVRGSLLVVGQVPGWPTQVVHLRDLPAPAGHLSALAATVPVTSVVVRDPIEVSLDNRRLGKDMSAQPARRGAGAGRAR